MDARRIRPLFLPLHPRRNRDTPMISRHALSAGKNCLCSGQACGISGKKGQRSVFGKNCFKKND